MSNNFKIKLVSVSDINIKVKSFTFEFLDDFEFSYTPGQFVSLNLTTQEGIPIRRSYSIASLNNKPNLLELAVTIVQEGRGTQVLCDLNVGDVVEASGPRGKFIFNASASHRQILVGTGTGVVPYRSMIPQIEAFLQNSNNRCVILQGVREEQEILFEEDFCQLSKYSNFEFKVCLSRDNQGITNPKNRIFGRVQDAFRYLVPNLRTDTFYLCGNPYMIEDVCIILKDLGFAPESVIREQYYPKKKE